MPLELFGVRGDSDFELFGVVSAAEGAATVTEADGAGCESVVAEEDAASSFDDISHFVFYF